METLVIYKLCIMKFTTQNDLDLYISDIKAHVY